MTSSGTGRTESTFAPSVHGQIEIRALQYGLPFGALSLTEPQRALCAVLAGAAGSSTPTGLLSQVLASAVAEGAAPPALPALAEAVNRRLRTDGLGIFSFAAVLACANGVQVSTAGDLRVHLLEGGEIIHVTRDHILRNDPPPGLPPGFAEQYWNLTSRGLGGNRETAAETLFSLGPPETLSWPANPPYRVVICSEEYHRYESPDSYWPALAEGLESARSAPYPGALLSAGFVLDLRFD